jgi:hypothetical protein
VKNNACSGRTSPKGPIPTAALRELPLLREGEALDGVGFRHVPALLGQRIRHLR